MRNIRLIFVLAVVMMVSCAREELVQEGDSTITGYPDWSEQTHGNSQDPDYSTVFPQDAVIRLDIVLDESNWEMIMEDLDTHLGGSFEGPGGMPPGETDFDPVWVPCSVYFNGIEWYQVGIRVKGNSSLRGTYNSGSEKYSFKLDFDEYEDDYPELKNQRFYGFKQLNLKNNYEDHSGMREKVSSDLFRDFGLVSSRTAFAAVYINRGQGEEYFGLYTLVEEVDDTVLENQFGDESGNLYKPENSGASFALGSFSEDDMNKKNNEDAGDYSDVQSLYAVLHDDLRTSDPAAWQEQLEEILDVDVFLKWLAANTAMQNWDTYGRMTHNYYLYHHHDSHTLNWIPWDGNEALEDGKMRGTLSISLSEVGSDWPLIRYLIDQPIYLQKYQGFLKEFSENLFNEARMSVIYDTWENLVTGVSESNPSLFNEEMSQLRQQVVTRVQLITDYLGQ